MVIAEGLVVEEVDGVKPMRWWVMVLMLMLLLFFRLSSSFFFSCID